MAGGRVDRRGRRCRGSRRRTVQRISRGDAFLRGTLDETCRGGGALGSTHRSRRAVYANGRLRTDRRVPCEGGGRLQPGGRRGPRRRSTAARVPLVWTRFARRCRGWAARVRALLPGRRALPGGVEPWDAR